MPRTAVQSDHAVDVVTEAGAFAALEPEWRDLWRLSGASWFQSPAWLIPWWEAFHPGSLRCIVVHSGDRLVGIAPFYLQVEPPSGTRYLRLVGSGTSDILDVIVEPSLSREVGNACTAALAADPCWDVCDWFQLPGTSPLLGAAAPERVDDHRTPGSPRHVLSLPVAGTDLSAVVPPRTLKNLRTARRRAERMGLLRVTVADASTLEEDMEDLLRLHAARWRERGADGVFASRAVRQFHVDAAPRLLAAGLLRLYTLHAGDMTAAALYALDDGRRVGYYIGGFDPEAAEISPGALLIEAAVEDALARGLDEFDFLTGDEAYKSDWGARRRVMFRRRLVRVP